jgi:hypothetical protein
LLASSPPNSPVPSRLPPRPAVCLYIYPLPSPARCVPSCPPRLCQLRTVGIPGSGGRGGRLSTIGIPNIIKTRALQSITASTRARGGSRQAREAPLKPSWCSEYSRPRLAQQALAIEAILALEQLLTLCAPRPGGVRAQLTYGRRCYPCRYLVSARDFSGAEARGSHRRFNRRRSSRLQPSHVSPTAAVPGGELRQRVSAG